MKEISPDKWIPEDKYKKLRHQTFRQYAELLGGHLTMYEYKHDVPMLSEECTKIAEIFCEAVRGRDIPITSEVVKYRRRKGKK